MYQDRSVILKTLREQIEQAYAEAMRSYRLLAVFLTGERVSESFQQSFSEIVLNALDDSAYKSIQQVCDETGLDRKDVRGVLYDRRHQDGLEREKKKGRALFRLKA